MTSNRVADPPAGVFRGSLGATLVLGAGLAILATTLPAAWFAGRFASNATLQNARNVMTEKAELVGDALAVYEGSAWSAAERLHRTFLAESSGEITVMAGRTTRPTPRSTASTPPPARSPPCSLGSARTSCA
jgi:hypothetical protein